MTFEHAKLQAHTFWAGLTKVQKNVLKHDFCNSRINWSVWGLHQPTVTFIVILDNLMRGVS